MCSYPPDARARTNQQRKYKRLGCPSVKGRNREDNSTGSTQGTPKGTHSGRVQRLEIALRLKSNNNKATNQLRLTERHFSGTKMGKSSRGHGAEDRLPCLLSDFLSGTECNFITRHAISPVLYTRYLGTDMISHHQSFFPPC